MINLLKLLLKLLLNNSVYQYVIKSLINFPAHWIDREGNELV